MKLVHSATCGVALVMLAEDYRVYAFVELLNSGTEWNDIVFRRLNSLTRTLSSSVLDALELLTRSGRWYRAACSPRPLFFGSRGEGRRWALMLLTKATTRLQEDAAAASGVMDGYLLMTFGRGRKESANEA